MIKKFLSVLILLSVSIIGFSQTPEAVKAAEKAYQKRITQTHLNNVYIPSDLPDAFAQLNKLISREAKVKFRHMPEKEAMVKLHYSLGRWIWRNWGFMEGSRLSVKVGEHGVRNPEDMAVFVIVAYHRYVNQKPLELDNIAELLNTRRKTDEEKRRKAAEGNG